MNALYYGLKAKIEEQSSLTYTINRNIKMDAAKFFVQTYLFLKPTLTLTSHLGQNVELRGGVGGQFPRSV